MTLTRISTLSLQQTTLANALRVQNNIFDAQQQISSGIKAQTFAELPTGDVEILSSVEDRLAKTDQYKKENARLLSRVDSTDQSLSQLIDVANEMKNLIAQRRNGAISGSLAFAQQIRSGFQTIANQLNANVDGRYIFSGARTDTKPIDETTLPDPFIAGTPDSGYYQGSTEDITSRIQDDQVVNSSVRADDPAFQKMMAAIATALEGDGNNDDDTLQRAYNFMQDAVSGVVELRADLGATRKSIVGANDRHDAQLVYWKGVKEDTLNADVVALATKLSSDSATLQATFQTFARINNLKLSDYL